MLTIEKYKGTRFWAVFRDGELLAVTGTSVEQRRSSGRWKPGTDKADIQQLFFIMKSSCFLAVAGRFR